MTLTILAVDLEVQCIDGTIHQGIKLGIDGTRRVYLSEDGTELNDVESINQCTLIVDPFAFASVLHLSQEDQ